MPPSDESSSQNRSFPVLFTKGTFFDVGHSVGSTFAQRIHSYFNESILVQEKLLPFYASNKGRQAYEEYLSVATKAFPQYISEIKGTALGSHMPFEHLFLLNISKEVYNFHYDRVFDVIDSGCSDIHINRPNRHLLVHNEDCDPLHKKYGYFVNAKINDLDFSSIGEKTSLDEHFTAFTYAGTLSGSAFGFNANGFAITMNGLYPNIGTEGAATRYFLNRSLLTMTSIDSAVRIIKNTGYGCAYGFCANIADVRNPGRMWSLEVGPGKTESNYNLHKIPQVLDERKDCHYFHFNSYKHLAVDDSKKTTSSSRRHMKAQTYPPPRMLTDAMSILGDSTDPEYPIYRTPRPTDLGETVATVVFDIDNRKMTVYMDNPSLKDTEPVLVLPLL